MNFEIIFTKNKTLSTNSHELISIINYYSKKKLYIIKGGFEFVLFGQKKFPSLLLDLFIV